MRKLAPAASERSGRDHLRKGSAKYSNIFKYFQSFRTIFRTFRIVFRKFSNVFERYTNPRILLGILTLLRKNARILSPVALFFVNTRQIPLFSKNLWSYNCKSGLIGQSVALKKNNILANCVIYLSNSCRGILKM
jgi:hypothetical protein